MSVVVLHIYDLSGGLAAAWSPMLLGRRIEAIYHTGVVVFQREYYFGGGIQSATPGQTPCGRPLRLLVLGETGIDEETLRDFLSGISSRFHVGSYDLLRNNCNHFADELCRFLVGKGVPEEIMQLPQQVLETPLGPFLSQFLRPPEVPNEIGEPGSRTGSVSTANTLTLHNTSSTSSSRGTSEGMQYSTRTLSSSRDQDGTSLPVQPQALLDESDKGSFGNTAMSFGIPSTTSIERCSSRREYSIEVDSSWSRTFSRIRPELETLGMPASIASMLSSSSSSCGCSTVANSASSKDNTKDEGQAALAQLIVNASEETAQCLLEWLSRSCRFCAGRRRWCAGSNAAFWLEIGSHWRLQKQLSCLVALLATLDALLHDPASSLLLLTAEVDQPWIAWLVHCVDGISLDERRIWIQTSCTLCQLGRSALELPPASQERVIAVLLWELAGNLEVWRPGLQANDEVATAIQHLLQDMFTQSEVARELGRSLDYQQVMETLLPTVSAERIGQLLEQQPGTSSA
ncbi:hypothetical protein CCYA_CCYA16G4225 [Cyanidiococcus yangmingshanensis]|nr:hypothetical protein CCYA_CCYA16G4225 [Cyanidiococcus yangmingshanensis]